MLVDIPAAQHKTIFFIVDGPYVPLMHHLYRGPTDTTTALPLLCVRHHKIMKPVSVLGLKTVKSGLTGLQMQVVLSADDTVFALLLGFIKRFINAHH